MAAQAWSGVICGLFYIAAMVLVCYNVCSFRGVLLETGHTMIAFYLFAFMSIVIRLWQTVSLSFLDEKPEMVLLGSFVSTTAQVLLAFTVVCQILEYKTAIHCQMQLTEKSRRSLYKETLCYFVLALFFSMTPGLVVLIQSFSTHPLQFYIHEYATYYSITFAIVMVLLSVQVTSAIYQTIK